MLHSVLDNFSRIKVFCVGDVMLDHFLYGKVDRISPEAPVPVFNMKNEKKMLGGAGNVLANLSALGVSPDIFCFVGSDRAGKETVSLLKNFSPSPLVVTVRGYPSIEKTRIIAGNNHLLRIDSEKSFKDVVCPFVKAEVEKRIRESDIILLSDYAKGMLTEVRTRFIIEKCRAYRKRVIIDPKGSDYSKYQGASMVKPNLKEFNEACGTSCHPSQPDFNEVFLDAAKILLRKYNIESILVTLSEYGMIFVESATADKVVRIPTEAKEVYDVSGAGDTSLSALGASLAAGADVYEAMQIANTASGIAVGKLGTSSVSLEEIRSALMRKERNMLSGSCSHEKIISREKAAGLAAHYRKEGKTIGFTNGCFDLLHVGHLQSFAEAKRSCDILFVGLNTDASVKKLKGEKRPIQDEKTRSFLLASLEYVDYVILFDELTALPLVQELHPDKIFKEGYSIEKWPEGQYVQNYGGEAVVLPHVEGFSTTKLIERIVAAYQEK